MNPVRIHEGGGAIHDRTTFVILCNASMKRNGQPATTDTLPCTYTYIFRGGGGGGGGRGGHVNLTTKKTNSDSVVCLFVFFCFFLSLRLILQKSNG